MMAPSQSPIWILERLCPSWQTFLWLGMNGKLKESTATWKPEKWTIDKVEDKAWICPSPLATTSILSEHNHRRFSIALQAVGSQELSRSKPFRRISLTARDIKLLLNQANRTLKEMTIHLHRWTPIISIMLLHRLLFPQIELVKFK